MIVDPTKVNFTDLTGQERVGVINRNTQEKVNNTHIHTYIHRGFGLNFLLLLFAQLPLKQSPMLKNLRLWLEGHPHYNVQHTWGALVIEWVSTCH